MTTRGLVVAGLLMALACAAGADDSVEHSVVYFEEGRFAGWPANNGIWSWDDEIVVGFTLGYYKDNRGGHAIDRDRPSVQQQARSLDGGETWVIETPSYLDEDGKERPAKEPTGGIDFTHPDFAARFKGGLFYYSQDRCRTWEGPFNLPDFGRRGLLARTDYLVNGKHDLTAFIATEKDDGGEGWPCCIRTTDGGKTWDLVGWIGEQPPTNGYGYSIMPSTVRLDGTGLLSMIRRGGVFNGRKSWWIEAYLSPDEGRSWYLLDEPRIDNAGNPASMIRLQDGRIALTYGWRHSPYGVRAMISDDDGQTWGEEIVLRHDGASWDIGYPRTVQRADGMCVTTYYYHHPDNPERYIASTIWDPGWVERFAGRVYDAWGSGEPMPQLSPVYPEASLDNGYAIQKAFVARILKDDKVGGFKAAVVGSAGQENLGIDEPVTGVVPASSVLRAADKIVIDLADDPSRKLETEIGYVFAQFITSPLENVEALREHVAAVVPVIEVPGGATENVQPSTAADIAAVNGNAKTIIVGDEHDPNAIDVDAVAITLTRDGETISTARGDQAAGGQWATLLKTVNDVVGRGYTIQPGHVLTNGALGSILSADVGQYRADYGPLGAIAFTAKHSKKPAQ